MATAIEDQKYGSSDEEKTVDTRRDYTTDVAADVPDPDAGLSAEERAAHVCWTSFSPTSESVNLHIP